MNKDLAIKVENLGKKYQIGKGKKYLTLRDSIVNFLQRPFSGNNHQDIWALKDVSFEVKKGEVLGIIGPNGAGKSTLLKILTQITKPTTGRVQLRGRVSSLLEVGTGFHPELTGRENIYMNGAILGMTRKEIKKKFDDIVEFSGLEKFLDTPVKRYSSGMRVRLALSVAAHLEPEILLIDEVLSVGDAAFQKKCLGKMDEVAKQEGRTVLFVSHDMASIIKLCKRVILLDRGEVKNEGYPKEVIKEYMNSTLSKRVYKKKKISSIDKNFVLKKVNISGEDSTPIYTGGKCSIKLVFQLNKEIINPAPIVSISSMEGIELIRLSTSPISNVYTGKQKGFVKFLLEINNLLLSAGDYVLSVGLAIPNAEYLIKPTEVLKFEIKPNDYYESGHIIDTRKGYLVTDHKWTVKSGRSKK